MAPMSQEQKSPRPLSPAEAEQACVSIVSATQRAWAELELPGANRRLYEDNHLLALAKAPGLAVQGGAGIETCLLDTVAAALKRRDRKAGQVFLAAAHRLDQPVGGLLLLAKTSKAASRLQASSRAGQWQKCYLAVVQGRAEEGPCLLEDYLVKDRQRNHSRTARADERGARYSQLIYSRLAYSPREDQSLLLIALGTGRSHQIRVQLASRGLALAGDWRYGQAGSRADLALWSTYLSLPHPIGGRGRWTCFEAPAKTGFFKIFAREIAALQETDCRDLASRLDRRPEGDPSPQKKG